jgi:single-strand DNA-binding protein
MASGGILEHKVLQPCRHRGTLLQKGRQGIRGRFCKKGDKVYVEGSIEYRSWQDREGQTRYTTEINGRELILLSGKGEGAESFTAPSKVGAGAAAPKGKESFDDFPEALDAEDDDLPF